MREANQAVWLVALMADLMVALMAALMGVDLVLMKASMLDRWKVVSRVG